MLKKLCDDIYFLPYEELSDRPNLYYIKGEDYAVAVDAGNSKRHVEKFYQALAEEGFPLPEYTIISHWHWDHTFGLKYINGQSMSSRLTHEKLEEVRKWKWDLASMKERERSGEDIPFCNDHIVIEYPDLKEIEVVNTDIIIEEDTVLDLGGLKVELLPRDSTHSRDALFVYIPEKEVLIVEDADNYDFYEGEIYYQDKLEQMIAFFENLNYKKHCLGHADYETKEFALNRLKAERK